MDALFGMVPRDACEIEMGKGAATEPPQKDSDAAQVQCVEDTIAEHTRTSSLSVDDHLQHDSGHVQSPYASGAQPER